MGRIETERAIIALELFWQGRIGRPPCTDPPPTTQYTGLYEGTSLGTITLCQDCGFAIQLRREPSETLGEYDCWVHFRLPITPHTGRPVRCWSDYDCYGNPT